VKQQCYHLKILFWIVSDVVKSISEPLNYLSQFVTHLAAIFLYNSLIYQFMACCDSSHPSTITTTVCVPSSRFLPQPATSSSATRPIMKMSCSFAPLMMSTFQSSSHMTSHSSKESSPICFQASRDPNLITPHWKQRCLVSWRKEICSRFPGLLKKLSR